MSRSFRISKRSDVMPLEKQPLVNPFVTVFSGITVKPDALTTRSHCTVNFISCDGETTTQLNIDKESVVIIKGKQDSKGDFI